MDWFGRIWLDALGWGGSALLVLSLMQARVLRFRTLNVIACAVLLVFNGILGIWPMVAMNAALAAINLWFIIKLVREKDDETVFTVLATSSDDVYLRHILRVHAADISSFQPDFDPDASLAVAGTTAYLVLNHDETVGVVVLHARGDTAHVVLDYVTPRYRDFTPGQFVWRRSGMLREQGFRRVVTSPTMIDAYYDRIGFRREGASFELDL